MELNADWVLVIVTSVYAATTLFIWWSNRKSADAAQKSVNAANSALEESKKQFTQSFELQKKSTEAAIAALEESKKQFKQNIDLQKQHNRDSVRPAVSIHFSGNANPHSYNGSIELVNHGLGPARIKGMRFINDNGKEYKNKEGFCTFLDLVRERVEEEILGLEVKEVFFEYYSREFRDNKYDADFLNVGERIMLLQFSARNRKEAENVAEVFRGLSVELTYTDFYDSPAWTINKRLTYFVHCWEYLGSIDKLRKIKYSPNNTSE